MKKLIDTSVITPEMYEAGETAFENGYIEAMYKSMLLAAPVAEPDAAPVAWRRKMDAGHFYAWDFATGEEYPGENGEEYAAVGDWEPLYTRPPRQIDAEYKVPAGYRLQPHCEFDAINEERMKDAETRSKINNLRAESGSDRFNDGYYSAIEDVLKILDAKE